MRTPEPAERPEAGGAPVPGGSNGGAADGRAPGTYNALGSEPSAYLRQHADNPVFWQPFGDEAFALAAARDVPVFLSIGYAACHWCHVMEHESFEDQETADYLNSHFVSIKVDREERPDVDAVYMAATQAISGEGGWPMSVFLTPEGLAFHAGTYYPPRPAHGRPSFRQVLEAVWEAWTERRDAVEHNARGLAGNIAEAHRATAIRLDGPPQDVDPRLLSDAVRVLARSEDPDSSGFGNAPKFPPSAVLEFLIRHAAMASDTADSARGMAGRTLAAMARSALFDQLDGGFARYSVTADWSVPHFEKMLYDNAQLLRVYTHWVRLGGSDDFAAHEAAEIATRTAEWMLGSLGLGPSGTPGAGGFASSLDADTVVDGEHHEGAVYLWTPEQLVEALGPGDGAAVAKLMGIGPEGTVSHLGSPLHPAKALDEPASRLWARVRPALLEFRNRRAQPARDDKVVAGWNGLAIGALAEAGAVLGEPRFVEAAKDAAEYLASVHWHETVDNGMEEAPRKESAPRTTLLRVSHERHAGGIGGLLEDYVFAADGFLALYAVTGEDRWYRLAVQVTDAAAGIFAPGGRLADTAAESAQVFNAQGGFAGLDPFDGATPSGAAAFAGVLVSLSAYSGSEEYRSMAGNILSLLPPIATRAPRIAGWLLATGQAVLSGPVEAAVVGPDDHNRHELHLALLTSPSPGMVVALGPGDGGTGDGGNGVPLLAGRSPAPDGGAQVYLCRNMVCDRPVRTVDEVRLRLREMAGLGEGLSGSA